MNDTSYVRCRDILDFARLHPECYDPGTEQLKGRGVADAFALFLSLRGYNARVVRVALDGTRYPYRPGEKHYAVRVGGAVYDFAARRFIPSAPVPFSAILEPAGV